MKAAVLHGVGDLVCEQVPIPEHEFGGTIAEAGSGVSKELCGKRVAVIPLIPCKTCKSCETGQYAQCEHYDFLGSRNDGGFAEYVKVPESNLLFVPENVDEEAVAFLEPISVALHVVQNCRVNYGDSVAVFGLGAIGIFVAQWAKAFGAKHVFAIDLDEKKVEIAKSMGLVDALCIGKDDIDAIVKEKTNGTGIDRAFEASGAGAAFKQAISLLRMEGTLGLVGRPVHSLEIENQKCKEGIHMENVLLARVDDRLIHGQVMTAWMKLLPAKEIIVIDNKVAKDEFMITVLEMAAPTGVKVKVFTEEKAAEVLQAGLSKPTILLAKSPVSYKGIIDRGVELEAINLGGMGINNDRTTLYKNIAASPAEREAIKEFLDKGIDVKIQVIPADKVVEVKDIL